MGSSLKRTLSLPVVTLYGLGTIIGAGIYVLIGEVVATSGYLTPAAFLLAAVIAAFSAFSYAELASRFPLSAGEAIYVDRAFEISAFSTIIGLLMVFVGIVASATLVRGFIGYFQYLIPIDDYILIVLLVAALGGFAAWGISQSAWLAIVTTLIEIGGLLLIIWVTRSSIAELPLVLEKLEAQILLDGWGSVPTGAFIAFFAFLGFEDIVNVAEEVKNPSRNLPWAVILSLLISALLYIAISIAVVTSVPPAELAGNPAPLALVYERAVGESAVFIVVIGIAAIINGTLVMMIMATRILYGMSRQQWLPSQLSEINHKTGTPLFATALITLLVLFLALWFPVTTLAVVTSLFTLIVFFSVNLSLLVIKLRDRQSKHPPVAVRCYPIWISVAGILSISAFILAQIYDWAR